MTFESQRGGVTCVTSGVTHLTDVNVTPVTSVTKSPLTGGKKVLRPLLRGAAVKGLTPPPQLEQKNFIKKKKKINSWTVRAVRKIFGKGAANRFEPRPNVTKQAPPPQSGAPPVSLRKRAQRFFWGG